MENPTRHKDVRFMAHAAKALGLAAIIASIIYVPVLGVFWCISGVVGGCSTFLLGGAVLVLTDIEQNTRQMSHVTVAQELAPAERRVT